MSDRKRVLVTGFRPFRANGVEVTKNASEEAVKLMNIRKLQQSLNIKLRTRVVPVEYKIVHNFIPKLWKKFQPHLTIHMGLGNCEGFRLEKMARKATYEIADTTAVCPADVMNPCEGPQYLATDLDVDLICNELNCTLNQTTFKAHVSDDAGKFLCEYIYYTTLSQQLDYDCKNSLLVHVPYLECPKAFQEIAEGLEHIVEICVNHIRKKA